MKWLAIYVRYLPESEHDPFAFESYGWEVEAENSVEALEILERRPDVPWRMFLVEVIPSSELEEWQCELEVRHRVKIRR
jgi:hypothetical protein